MEPNELPLGFGMALAQHPDAMRAFVNLPEDRRAVILRQAHCVSSKEEMQSLINDLRTVP